MNSKLFKVRLRNSSPAWSENTPLAMYMMIARSVAHSHLAETLLLSLFVDVLPFGAVSSHRLVPYRIF